MKKIYTNNKYNQLMNSLMRFRDNNKIKDISLIFILLGALFGLLLRVSEYFLRPLGIVGGLIHIFIIILSFILFFEMSFFLDRYLKIQLNNIGGYKNE